MNYNRVNMKCAADNEQLFFFDTCKETHLHNNHLKVLRHLFNYVVLKVLKWNAKRDT